MAARAPSFDSQIRLAVYDHVVRAGRVPTRAELAASLGAPAAEVEAALGRLAEAHALVLQPSGELLMANPFSAVPTPFLVRPLAANGHALPIPHAYYGNCIWDALGIPAALGVPARIETACGCCSDRVAIVVREAKLDRDDWLAHFALPARRWWDDIVFN